MVRYHIVVGVHRAELQPRDPPNNPDGRRGASGGLNAQLANQRRTYPSGTSWGRCPARCWDPPDGAPRVVWYRDRRWNWSGGCVPYRSRRPRSRATFKSRTDGHTGRGREGEKRIRIDTRRNEQTSTPACEKPSSTNTHTLGARGAAILCVRRIHARTVLPFLPREHSRPSPCPVCCLRSRARSRTQANTHGESTFASPVLSPLLPRDLVT